MPTELTPREAIIKLNRIRTDKKKRRKLKVTCKDCLHAEVCEEYGEVFSLIKGGKCSLFKDRSRFVELPDVGDYDTVTTIDEAIDHCYQIATSTNENICVECKAEHMRLCGWLGDLKRRIIAEQALKLKERENNA